MPRGASVVTWLPSCRVSLSSLALQDGQGSRCCQEVGRQEVEPQAEAQLERVHQPRAQGRVEGQAHALGQVDEDPELAGCRSVRHHRVGDLPIHREADEHHQRSSQQGQG